jgi:muramoyltetrapeptide carboxypeptidase
MQSRALLRPRSLRPGDRIALVAPASSYDEEAARRGAEILAAWDLSVELPARLEPVRYLAASDDERARQLTEAFTREEIAGIVAIRGGFGFSRLLGLFDPAVATAHPKMFVGYSDLTILLSRLSAEAGVVSFHGPMAASDLPRLGPDQLERFRRFLFGEDGWWAGGKLGCRASGAAKGRLVGGCLSVIVTTIGTPYEIDTKGAVLFLEDVNESPYRIDRMLTHLSHAGKLAGVAAVVLGSFHGCGEEEEVLAIADEILSPLRIPVVSGFDAGHGSGGAVLPIGCEVFVDADAGSIELLEPVFASHAASAPASAKDLARLAAAAARRGPGFAGR